VPPQPARLADLLDRYDGILLDAYGVLKDVRGALPGAAELIARLVAEGRPYAVVTNDASRSPATIAGVLAGIGLPVPAGRILCSGELVGPYLREAGLAGARCLVLGTADSRDFVRAGGGVIADLDAPGEVDAIVVADDSGFPFLAGVETAVSIAVRGLDAGRMPALILPNPDLVYPRGGGDLGLTAGSIALIVEAVLARRTPAPPRFVHLGKPEPRLFELARQRLGVDRLLMVGDQLETDVAGARAAGLDAALLEGVSRWTGHGPEPTWLLSSLA
jgi:glycerol-1-phosphatase